MRILIFGAGAMGSLFGGLLSQRHDVTLVGRRAHVEAIRRDGLRIRGRTELHAWPRVTESAADADPPDLVVVTVKSYDTAAAAEAIAPLANALCLSLQNGLGNLEQLAARLPRVLGGVTYQGVTQDGSGAVSHAGLGETLLGPFRGAGAEDAERVARAFRESGLPTSVSGDLAKVLWTKAVVNACFNPLTALLRVRSGVLGRDPSLIALCREVIEEARAVAAAHRVLLDPDVLMRRVDEVAHATADNRSSMLQDLERGRRTEIDAINGALDRFGAERGIDCPVNRTLTRLIHAAEKEAGSGP